MAEPFKTLWKEATLAILFGTLLIILLAGFIVFLDWHMDSVLTCIKRCLKWCLMWAFILVIIVPASVLGFVLLVVAVVLVVVGVLGLVMLEAGVEEQEDAVPESDFEKKMVQLDRDSETGRTVTDLTQELLEYLSQEAKGIAGLTENRKALLAEMEEERDATLEMLERLTQEAEKLVALRETALELLEKRTQEAEKISALNDIRVERDTEARNGPQGMSDSPDLETLTPSFVSVNHTTAGIDLTRQVASSGSGTSTAPQPNSASWTSAPDDNIILSKLATEAIETPTSRTFDTENQTAHRLASLKPPELGDNNRDVSSPQSSTNAENNPLNSPTHLSARAQRAWMKGKDLPLVPERSRSPYETGLFTGVRGANGIEGAQGGNDGDEEEY